MKRRVSENVPQERDRHLDVPAEANRDKHINYLEQEEQANSSDTDNEDSPFYIPNNTPGRDSNSPGGNRA